MKSLYAIAAACLLAGIGLFGMATAHETVEHGTATMFVHIDPVEPPVAGTLATIFINLTNSEKSFSVRDCDCMLTVAHDKTILLKVVLEASDDPDTFGIKGVPVAFMTAGEYDLTVSGAPKVSSQFTSFDVDYDVDVLPAGSTSTPHSHGSPFLHDLHLLVLWGGIAASTLVVYRERKEIFKRK